MIVCSFYKFINIDDTNLFKKLLLHTCKDRYINGTFILAKEGINASFSGEKKAVQEVQKFLKKKVGADISFKLSTCTKNPFLRLRVKVKKSSVNSSVPVLQYIQYCDVILNYFFSVFFLFFSTSTVIYIFVSSDSGMFCRIT